MADNITTKLVNVQSDLKAPKGQYNSFGKYKYRSCEDILEAVKPHLKKNGLALVVKDEIVEIAGRIYVKATAKVIDENGAEISTTAFAREPQEKKGMDDSQVTGSSSSYARKYALNGLFAIDDNKDADSISEQKENTKTDKKTSSSSKKKAEEMPQQPIQELPDDFCTICRLPIMDFSGKNNNGDPVTYTKQMIIDTSRARFKAPICMDCMMKKAAKDKAKKKMNMDGEYQAIIHEDAGDRV